MIEATEIQTQGDLFDFLRITDDEVLALMGPDDIGPGSNVSLQFIHQSNPVIQSGTEIKEKA